VIAHRILVLEDDTFTRSLLVTVLGQLGFENLREAADATTALQLFHAERSDACLLDIDLGLGPNGLDVARGLRKIHPTVGLVFLSAYDDLDLVSTTDNLPDGAIYLRKSSLGSPEMLKMALDQVLQHPLAKSPPPGLGASPLTMVRLTRKQKRVMRLISEGFTNSEIARMEGLSHGSVEKSITRIAAALGVQANSSRNVRVLIARTYYSLTPRPSRHQVAVQRTPSAAP